MHHLNHLHIKSLVHKSLVRLKVHFGTIVEGFWGLEGSRGGGWGGWGGGGGIAR